MKKILIVLFLVFFPINTLFAHTNEKQEVIEEKALTDEECQEIIENYNIDPRIKSKRGWERVFKDESWKKKFHLNKYTQAELDCIYDYILRNALEVSKYDNFVGREIAI